MSRSRTSPAAMDVNLSTGDHEGVVGGSRKSQAKCLSRTKRKAR